MNRRAFLQTLLSSTMLASLPAGVGLLAQTPPPPPMVALTISATFMQDYVIGAPYTNTAGREATYVAADGTINVCSAVLFDMIGQSPSH